jgi:regulator of protease activity HflC (stomatin/prohibitin superfamily)
MDLQAFVGPWPLFQFSDPIHSLWDSLDRGSASQNASTHTQDNTKIDIHTSNDIRIHDPSVWAYKTVLALSNAATVIRLNNLKCRNIESSTLLVIN